ncbi:hypothetical protein M0811_05625 [Anaeramoeba ignava]|uniref:BTB domain-containing protein n=1 Tax=Anaeramoeba ignava TaxID=1746090 RepID=A0A9Q0LSK8_ANAIG|nr:hypothetical protein M0811_05625 [Anaeramoeba ignava]
MELFFDEQALSLMELYSSFRNDMVVLYERKEKCDLIFQATNGSIPVHSSILFARLNNIPIETLSKVFGFREKREIDIFFKWIYGGLIDSNEENDIINEIGIEIGLNEELIKQKTGIDKLKEEISFLYFDDEGKDFTIISGDSSVKIHSSMLLARSDLYRGMLLMCNDDSNKVTDYSGLSIQALQTLIHFIYFDEILENVPISVLKELKYIEDYFQLSLSSSLVLKINEILEERKLEIKK